MTDQDLIDFGIWREMDEDLTAEEAKQEALEASQGAIAELRDKGVKVEWVSTDVLEDPDSDTDCAYCHYPLRRDSVKSCPPRTPVSRPEPAEIVSRRVTKSRLSG